MYSGFIPLDLTVMVVSWEKRNLFEWNKKCSWLKWALQTQWNSPLNPKVYINDRKWRWGNSSSWSQSTTRGSSNRLWYHVQKHMYLKRGQTPSITTHITRSKINTPMFWRGKTPTGKHPRPQPIRPLGVVY